MSLFLTTVFVFGFVILIMAIGVILGNRRIKGSCGGEGGCDFCLFKNKKNCEDKSAGEENTAQTGSGEPGGNDTAGLAEEILSDTGK